MNKLEEFTVALSALHAAALDDGKWHEASRAIDQLCGAKGNGIAFGYTGSREEERILFADLSFHGAPNAELFWEYMNDYYRLDERIPRLLRLGDSQIVHTPELYSKMEKKNSIVFNGLFIRAHFRNGLSVRMDGPKGSNIVWNLGNPLKNDSWSSAQVASVRELLPHLRQCIATRKMLVDAGALGNSLQAMLENMRCGIVQLDWRGRIMAANDTALRVFKQGNTLVDSGGVLGAVSRTDDVSLQRMLARALPRFGKQATSGSMKVTGCDKMRESLVQVTPLSGMSPDIRPWSIAALVFISEDEPGAGIDPMELGAAFGLTRTESLVTVLLAQGRTASSIAKQWNRSERTIRWHISQIFSKLGISRQAELVRRVFLLSGRRNMPGSS
ncbi:MAG: hypothetical protein F4Y00_07940 [Bacteroidetes bacterium SB0662_bin_6]|nr:hypothetical protein [Bacteroidetes bacterium SB0662_bin_6]